MPLNPSGRPYSTPTIHRWVRPGVRGHRLRTVCIGGIRHTTEEWLWQFFQSLSDVSEPMSAGG